MKVDLVIQGPGPRIHESVNPVFLAENSLKTSQKHRFTDEIHHNIFTKF